MVGEIIAGAVQGVAKAAGESLRAPVQAVAHMGTVAASIPKAASVMSETASVVTRSLEPVKSLTMPLGKAVDVPSHGISLANSLSAVAKTGDSHSALKMLAFGDTARLPKGIAEIPDTILRKDFVDLERLGPKAAQGLTAEVDSLLLPKDMVGDPQFLEQFAKEFGQDVATQKARMQEGKLSADQYMAMRQEMLKRSALKAEKKTKEDEVTNKDLEELKRKAAMDAIRRQMHMWRQNVMADTRLKDKPGAREAALRRIDLLERRLLVKEAIRWEGLSIMKVLALAVVWAQEAS